MKSLMYYVILLWPEEQPYSNQCVHPFVRPSVYMSDTLCVFFKPNDTVCVFFSPATP